MADGEAAQKPSAGNYSVSPFVKKEVHDQIANRSAKARVSWNWYDTWHEEHHRAFVVAKLCKADLLQEVHDSLQKAIDEGQTFEEWRKEIQPKLEGRWLGKTVGELWDELPEEHKIQLKEQAKKEGRKDPEPTGEQRDEVISPKRLETIYRTNMKVAHVAGQYQSLIDEAELYPYWQYHTQEDERVRSSHAVLNKKVFRYDDPFWDTHFPPNGWKCRCYVRSLNERGLKRQGLSTDDVLNSRDLKTREDKSAGGHSKLTYIIDGKEATTADGWNYNPGKVNQQIDAVADDKAEGYEPELRQQVKASLKKEEEPKPVAPKPASQPAAAPKPAQPAAAPKPKQADGAHGEPKPAAAPKAVQQTVKDNNVPIKSTAAVPKPAQLAAAPKPKQADGAHGEPKPTAAPKSAQPKSAPTYKPAAPRIIEPVKPADPSAPRVVEPVKPEVKQSILQTIRGKVSRAVDRVLDWLGVSSKKWSSFEKLNNGVEQNTYYGNFQPKELQSTAAKNAATAQRQEEENKELALVAAQNKTEQAVGQSLYPTNDTSQSKINYSERGSHNPNTGSQEDEEYKFDEQRLISLKAIRDGFGLKTLDQANVFLRHLRGEDSSNNSDVVNGAHKRSAFMAALTKVCGFDGSYAIIEEEPLSGSEHISILTYALDDTIVYKTVYDDEAELEYIHRCVQAFQTRDKTVKQKQNEDEEDTSWVWYNKDEHKVKWKGVHHGDDTPITIHPLLSNKTK